MRWFRIYANEVYVNEAFPGGGSWANGVTANEHVTLCAPFSLHSSVSALNRFPIDN